MNYTQSIGNIVELQCISKFIELGYEVWGGVRIAHILLTKKGKLKCKK